MKSLNFVFFLIVGIFYTKDLFGQLYPVPQEGTLAGQAVKMAISRITLLLFNHQSIYARAAKSIKVSDRSLSCI